MPPVKMHDGEVDTNESLVHRLLVAQFPQWTDLPIELVQSAGTDNAIYRLGDDMAVRLPRIHWAVGQADKERQWLPRLAPRLPLSIPVPLAKGAPAEGYPWHWSIYRWLEGKDATVETVADLRQAASDLAQFIAALQKLDTASAPAARERGLPLATQDTRVREAIEALRGMIDADAVTAAWEAALHAPDWRRPPVWIHGDLLPGNLLVKRGQLAAVIDFSALCVGDPACDLMSGWALFSGESREAFRAALSVDDATWARGRGWALSWALIFVPYYLHTNPAGVRIARRTIAEVLADHTRAA